MAKLEHVLLGNFDELLTYFTEGLLSTSKTASVEETSDFTFAGARSCTRVFERYSYTGQNRVSLCLTLFQSDGGPIFVGAITAASGGGYRKPVGDTVSDRTFLDKFKELLPKE
ncbi:MAG: hypothetical protein E7328_06475 [Clostridiales bacterium]|nr:hypothetical protein [Clostridiales bacterium]